MIILVGEITVHLRTLRTVKLNNFRPEGASIAIDFFGGRILAVLLTVLIKYPLH